MPNKTYQVKITLIGSKPKIWRRILIPSDLSLPDFHSVIQTTMGWTNSHLHQFEKNQTYYLPEMDNDDFWDDNEDNNVNYSELKVSDLLKKEEDKITYEYDFGDGWEHEIVLEKIENKVMNKKNVTCLKGRNSCPPEDCGGIWGYYDMLEVLKDPDHEEYEDYIDWLGEDFDPTYFDVEEVNEILGAEGY